MEKKRGRARFDRINEISCIDEDAASEVGCVRHKKKELCCFHMAQETWRDIRSDRDVDAAARCKPRLN